MNFKKISAAVFLTYNWDVRVKGDRQQLIDFYTRTFKTDSSVIGRTSWKTIFFMAPTIGGLIYNYSLIGFEGVIQEDELESTIHLKARFAKPFNLIYVGAVISFPLLYILDLQGARENLDFFQNHILNVLIPPTIVWSTVMLYYQLKISHGKGFINRSLRKFNNNRTTT